MQLLWTPGMGELLVILIIILLLFGGKKLPGLARSIGAGINEFKKGLAGQIEDENTESKKEIPKETSKEESKK